MIQLRGRNCRLKGMAYVDGQVVARPACILSLTFDHRLLDGATLKA